MAGQINIGKASAREVFTKVTDAVASVDIDQEDREKVAGAVVAAFQETRLSSFMQYPETYVLLASDPLVPCAGYDIPIEGDARGAVQHFDCPTGTVIRQSFHFSGDPSGLGRSAIWEQRAPYGKIRCVTCGSMQFIPPYRDAVLARQS